MDLVLKMVSGIENQELQRREVVSDVTFCCCCWKF